MTGHHFARFEEESTPVRRLAGLAKEIVLELGPGSGSQFPRFDRTATSRIYGIESNEYLFNKLRSEKIENDGLSDIYVPINAALEDDRILESAGIVAGSIDTVVCMYVSLVLSPRSCQSCRENLQAIEARRAVVVLGA